MCGRGGTQPCDQVYSRTLYHQHQYQYQYQYQYQCAAWIWQLEPLLAAHTWLCFFYLQPAIADRHKGPHLKPTPLASVFTVLIS